MVVCVILAVKIETISVHAWEFEYIVLVSKGSLWGSLVVTGVKHGQKDSSELKLGLVVVN